MLATIGSLIEPRMTSNGPHFPPVLLTSAVFRSRSDVAQIIFIAYCKLNGTNILKSFFYLQNFVLQTWKLYMYINEFSLFASYSS